MLAYFRPAILKALANPLLLADNLPMRQAFSLVELSIVLVILGLLTGGILAGQSLIRASEIRAVIADYQRYLSATHSFRDKYMALPGDMSNATRFWGRQSTNSWCVTNSGASVASSGTCDGNGNGGVSRGAAASESGENFQFWLQLAAAGLIEGTYTGIAGSGGNTHSTIGTNVPRTKMSNVGWYLDYISTFYAGDGNAYALEYGNYLTIGAPMTNAFPRAAFLKPEEAWNIDMKLDDGKPAYGKVIAFFWNNACAAADDGSSANNDLAASYRLSDSTLQCSLIFVRQF